MKKEVVVPLEVLGEIRQTALTLRDAVDSLLTKVEGLMDGAIEKAVQEPEVFVQEVTELPKPEEKNSLGLVKHFAVMCLGQPKFFATRQEADAYGRGAVEVWDYVSVLKLIDLAKHYGNKYQPDAQSELIKMAVLFESHNSMPYNEISRLALAEFHRYTKWCFVKRSSFAYNNMQNSLKLAADREKQPKYVKGSCEFATGFVNK